MHVVGSRDRVRLLVSIGGESHSVEGEVLSAGPDLITILRNQKEARIPSVAILSMEASRSGSAFTAASLPPPMASIEEELDQVFRSGSGGLIKTLDSLDADAAVDSVNDFRQKLASSQAQGLVDAAVLPLLLTLKLMLTAPTYDAVRRAYEKLESQASTAVEVIADYRESERLRRAVADLVGRISTLSERSWVSYRARLQPRPRFQTYDAPAVVSVSPTNEASFPLRLHLEDGFAPISQLVVLIDEHEAVQVLHVPDLIDQLDSGETRPVSVRATVDPDKFKSDPSVRLRVQLRYRQPDNQIRETPKQNILFRLHFPVAFTPLTNPFAAYAGGTAVADARMFFGRESIVDEIATQLEVGPLGQCFALSGQQRSGKSSVMEQVRSRLQDRKVLTIAISFGTIDLDSLTQSFVREVLEQIRVPLSEALSVEDYRSLQRVWPTDDRIERRPLESLRTSLTAGRRLLSRLPGWAAVRYVLLMDEFTYLYEIIRRPDVPADRLTDVREFMRQWKALLESQYFTALVVGQDTLPQFTRRFPNEFSSMNPMRLNYLTSDETTSLVTQPILRPDGSSRFLGYAGQTVFGYTDGHPFFTQIICDRLVRNANAQKRGDFTESDVIDAVSSLIEGRDAMDFIRFDCLLTADNTGALSTSDAFLSSSDYVNEDDQRDLAYGLLYRIAILSGEQNRPVALGQLDLRDEEKPLLQDLLAREVLVQYRESVRIRVVLFADFLRKL